MIKLEMKTFFHITIKFMLLSKSFCIPENHSVLEDMVVQRTSHPLEDLSLIGPVQYGDSCLCLHK